MKVALLLVLFALPSMAANPFVGDWALTTDGGAVWLGVEERGGQLSVGLMWRGGRVWPARNAALRDGKLYFEAVRNPSGEKPVDQFVASVEGDNLTLRLEGPQRAQATGMRQPPLPPAPDLSRVRWGAPVKLFNGKDLSGWRLTNPSVKSGWSVEAGVLMNRTPDRHATQPVRYGNIRTEREFEDFNLTLDFRSPPGGNSGVYLRGIYEVQVSPHQDGEPGTGSAGAIFGRIAPSSNAARPAGQWQSLNITLMDRHVTVVLNGVTVVDNLPLRGCTGGALRSDVQRPGPIYLQGDHTDVDFREVVLRPAIGP
jgi:hypothetical protein